MKPKEMLNIAYQEDVVIEPTANIPRIHLLEADIEDLKPLQVAYVPLYIALTLKKANLCRIRLPSYLKEERLQEVLDSEKENVDEYTRIPPRLFELSELLVQNAYNIPNPERIKVLVQEIREVRFKKTLEGMKALDGHAFNIDNLTEWEFCEVRPFVLKGSEAVGKFINKEK